MKTEMRIVDITHEDLVHLLSTALYGSTWLGGDYDKEFYNTKCERSEEDCLEDKMAKVLLGGGSIYLYDFFAEDEEDFHGDLPHKWSKDDEDMKYVVTLKDVKRGLELASEQEGYPSECFHNFITDDAYNLDLPQAECLLQYVMFQDYIYG